MLRLKIAFFTVSMAGDLMACATCMDHRLAELLDFRNQGVSFVDNISRLILFPTYKHFLVIVSTLQSSLASFKSSLSNFFRRALTCM